MSYPIAKGGGGTPPPQRDDRKDLLIPVVPAAVPLDDVPIVIGMESDHYTARVLCPDDDESVNDDPDVEDSHILKTVEEDFDEAHSNQMGFSDGLLGVGNDDDPPSFDNHFEACVNIDEEINIQAAGEENLASYPVSGGIEERMVEVEENQLEEGEHEDEAPVLIGVCGEDVGPEMSEYEKLRERNIREREEMMKEVLEDINEAKQDMFDNAPRKRKKADTSDEPKSKKRKVQDSEDFQVRRSGRRRKPVNYVVDEDEDKDSRIKKKNLSLEAPKYEEMHSSVGTDGQGSSSRTLRPRRPVCYTELDEPDVDSYIWCTDCDRLEFHGCETHATLFGDNNMFNLQVGESAVKAKNAGQGIFNLGKEVIPEGTVFGPYTGTFIPLSKYKQIEKDGKESGNAWEVKDKEGKKVVGYVDPGINPDPNTHWMSKVNCSMDIRSQNLVGFQLAGQVYYRAKQDIPTGAELLVFYGKGYARGLGIDVQKYERFSGEEDQTEDAVLCDYCYIGLASEDLARKHTCPAKKSAEQRRLGATGERKWVCTTCGKGFTSKFCLEQHGTVHTHGKDYPCTFEGCSKRYVNARGLASHKKTVHDGVYYECEECGRRFGEKSKMTRHFKTVHNNEKDYKCPTCGIKFGQKQTLTRHIKTVHDNIKSYECEHCGKRFGQAGVMKRHIEALHLGLRYSCTWRGGCGFTTGWKDWLPFHVRQVHTKEWSWECQLCEDQKGIWWGCLQPGQMDKHKAKNHPVEWEEEQEAFRQAHPHICKVKKCGKRFATKVEVDRHLAKLH